MAQEQPELKTNVIICGDCERRMKEHIPDNSVDLIYLDPPFFSGKDYDLIWNKKGETKSKATIKVFEDAVLYVKRCGKCGKRWHKNPNGEFYKTCNTIDCKGKLGDTKDARMSNVNVFVEWLRPRLEECKRVLKDTGSIYCHLDWHAIHYAKVMMDDVFGYDNLRNEIIWCYTFGATGTKQFSRKHDTILFYSKTKKWTFNNKEVLRKATSAWAAGKMITMQDWWDIPSINNKERIGYKTQKPEALLERIIKASSNPGDVILDPFCGCGTAVAVAQKLGRQYIGIDIEPLSCTIIQKRMSDIEGCNDTPIVKDIQKTLTENEANNIISQAKGMKGYDFQKWIIDVIGGICNDRGGDKGIDGWIDEPLEGKMLKYGKLEKGSAIQVKMSAGVGRETISQFTNDMDSEHGIIIAYSFADTNEAEKSHERGRDIELVTVRDILVLTDREHINASKKLLKGQKTISECVQS